MFVHCTTICMQFLFWLHLPHFLCMLHLFPSCEQASMERAWTESHTSDTWLKCRTWLLFLSQMTACQRVTVEGAGLFNSSVCMCKEQRYWRYHGLCQLCHTWFICDFIYVRIHMDLCTWIYAVGWIMDFFIVACHNCALFLVRFLGQQVKRWKLLANVYVRVSKWSSGGNTYVEERVIAPGKDRRCFHRSAVTMTTLWCCYVTLNRPSLCGSPLIWFVRLLPPL